MNDPMAAAAMDGARGAGDFVAKWRARWPEWAIAEVFVPAPRRGIAQAWMTLLQELGDAAWGGEDVRPGEAKLTWWAEELLGWSRGARRHPLGQALSPRAASWDALAAVAPFAVAAAAVEAEVSGTPATTSSSGDLASALLAERLLHHPDGAVPLQLLAGQADAEAAGGAWAAALLDAWPAGAPVARARRLHAMLQRARLGQRAAGVEAPRPLSRGRTLWRAWQAARRD